MSIVVCRPTSKICCKIVFVNSSLTCSLEFSSAARHCCQLDTVQSLLHKHNVLLISYVFVIGLVAAPFHSVAFLWPFCGITVMMFIFKDEAA